MTRCGAPSSVRVVAAPSGCATLFAIWRCFLLFRSARRCQRLALLFLRPCRFEEPSCVRFHRSPLSLVSAVRNMHAFCSTLGHRSDQLRGHLLQHHLPIDHMSHLRYSTSIPIGKRNIAPPANSRIIISIGIDNMSKATEKIFMKPHVSRKAKTAALMNK